MADNRTAKAKAMLGRAGYAAGGAVAGQALAKGGHVRGHKHVSVNVIVPPGGGGGPPRPPMPMAGPPPGMAPGLARPPGGGAPGVGMPPGGPPPGLAGGIPPGIRPPGMRRGGGVKRRAEGGFTKSGIPAIDESKYDPNRDTTPTIGKSVLSDTPFKPRKTDADIGAGRARGGRTGYPLDDGAGGGAGRREKIAAYGGGKR